MKAPSKKSVALFSAGTSLALHRLAPKFLYFNSVIASFLVLFFALVSTTATYNIVIYPKVLSPLKKLPRPSGDSFFLGQFPRIFRDPGGEPQKVWAREIPNDGLIYYRSIFNSERVLPTTIKVVAELLTHRTYDFPKPDFVVGSLEGIIGSNGILLVEGDEHKRQRKLLNPAFTARHIKDLYPIFWSKAREVALAVEKEISQKEGHSKDEASNIIEFTGWSTRVTLDIIGLAGFDQDFNAVGDPSNELYQAYQTIFSQSRAAQMLGLMQLVFPRWFIRSLPVKRNKDLRLAQQRLDQNCREIIADKKKKLEKGDAAGVDILTVALREGAFTDKELVDQVMTFLVAGHETTSTSMTWALYALGKHPEVQAKLREEIAASGLPSVHDTDATIDAVDIEKISYLSAVCNEVNRLYPPVTLTLRAAAHDTTLAGVFIPKGTTVVVSALQWNHSKELWGEDAEEFRPERWIEADAEKRPASKSNYGFMTFLHGPRSCIGQGFAKAEFMTLLAAWVSAFDTELEPKDRVAEFEGGVTTKPKGGLKVKLTPVS